MRALFSPTIQNIRFPHLVRGPGIFTPVEIKILGWGFLTLSYPKISESKPLKRFKRISSGLISFDVPKDTIIKVTIWNIFGFSTSKLIVPGNNTEVANAVAPQLPEIDIPKAQIYSPEIKTKSFSTSILGSLQIFPIRNLGGQLRTNFTILNRYLNSYRLNRTVKIESIQFAKAEHKTNYKLKVDFKSIQINNDQVTNTTKGSKS